MVKKHISKLQQWFPFEKESVGLFFLGVGVTMFLLNLITIINAVPYMAEMSAYGGYPLAGYYISIISSILLMTYSLYNVYTK